MQADCLRQSILTISQHGHTAPSSAADNHKTQTWHSSRGFNRAWATIILCYSMFLNHHEVVTLYCKASSHANIHGCRRRIFMPPECSWFGWLKQCNFCLSLHPLDMFMKCWRVKSSINLRIWWQLPRFAKVYTAILGSYLYTYINLCRFIFAVHQWHGICMQWFRGQRPCQSSGKLIT